MSKCTEILKCDITGKPDCCYECDREKECKEKGFLCEDYNNFSKDTYKKCGCYCDN